MMVKAPFTKAVDEFEFNRVYRGGMTGRFGDGILGIRPSTESIHFLLMIDEGKVVAAQKYYAGPDDPGEMYLAYLETAQDCKRQGYGARLFAAVFEHAVKINRPVVVVSEYSALGKTHLLKQERDILARHEGRLSIVHEPRI